MSSSLVYSETIAALNSGEDDERITDALCEVVQAVQEHNGAGAITVQLVVEHDKSGRCLCKIGKIAVKKPQPKPKATSFFYDATSVGGLTRDCQRSQQPELPMGNVTPIERKANENDHGTN